MTLDEAIRHATEVAEENETRAKKWQKEGGEKWGKTTVCRECAKEHRQLAEWLKELKQLRDQTSWIPVTYRPVTEEERIELVECFGIDYCDTYSEKMLSCPLPEDGQEILVSHETYVSEDICAWDGCLYNLENNGDWDGITAWIPKPKPYKAESEE